MTYPIAEYGQLDPLLQHAVGDPVFTSTERRPSHSSPIWCSSVIFPSGEIFYVAGRQAAGRADRTPSGACCSTTAAKGKTLLQVIREKNSAQGKTPVTRADLRFGAGPKGRCSCSTNTTGRSACSFRTRARRDNRTERIEEMHEHNEEASRHGDVLAGLLWPASR